MSTEETLTQYLRRKHAAKSGNDVHWEQVKKEWLDALKVLFKDLRDWLAEAEQEGTVQIEALTFGTKREENLGEYVVECLRLRVGDSMIDITPHARIIIGGKGRVDITCGASVVMLIRDAHDEWQIATRSPKITFATLTPAGFKEVLEQMIG